MSSGAGQCFFDLTCRLSYGQKVGGECESWHQVCCVFPDKLEAFNRQQRLLQYSAAEQQVTLQSYQSSTHTSDLISSPRSWPVMGSVGGR